MLYAMTESGFTPYAPPVERRRNVHPTFTYKGVTRTIREWSERTGIPYQVMYARIKCGMDAERVMHKGHLDGYQHTDRKTLTHGGITDTYEGWAKRLGVVPFTIMHRMKQYNGNLSLVLVPNKKHDGTVYEYGGKRMNLCQWAKHLGLDKTTVYDRMRCGMPIEKVLSRKRLMRRYKFNGMEKTIPEWAEHLRVSKECIYHRLKRGYPIEKVFTAEVSKRGMWHRKYRD